MFETKHPGFEKVYALWDDPKHIKMLQDASLGPTDFGLAQDHGLVGSAEWWGAIASGNLPLRTVTGTICDVALESMNDWPVFKIMREDGLISDSITQETLPMKSAPYEVGRRVIWEYVSSQFKKPHQGLGAESELTIAVWLAETTTLFRPVGEAEMKLIVEANFAEFPPRLPEQPIFYPVCNYRYAEEIASKWNAKEGIGYITRFAVNKQYLDGFEVQQVGGKLHQEYWIPAETLAEFNRNIVGKIRAVKSFAGSSET